MAVVGVEAVSRARVLLRRLLLLLRRAMPAVLPFACRDIAAVVAILVARIVLSGKVTRDRI